MGAPVTCRTERAAPAARVAVELREHDAGERQRLGEGLRDVHRILALHGIDDEERLDGLERRVDRAHLGHHRLVDRQAPRRVHDQHVVEVALRPVERGSGDGHRLLRGIRGKEVHVQVLRERGELVDGRGTIDVRGNHQHLFLRGVAQQARELSGAGRLARALQAREQDHGRRLGREVQASLRAAHELHQLLVDHADQRLARREAADDLLPERLLRHAADEVLHHRQPASASSSASRTSRSMSWMFSSVSRACRAGLHDGGEALRQGV
jgi:hypothetical protein